LLLQSAQNRLEVARMMAEWGQLEMLSGRVLRQATGQGSDLERIVENFERVPYEETRTFYETWFRPNNSALVLIGDITGDQAVPLVEQYFGAWEPAPIPVLEEIDIPLPQARMQYETEGAGPPLVRVSWPLPPASSPEYFAFAGLEDTLSGPDGVLAMALRDHTFGGGAWLGHERDFNVEVAVLETQSLPDTEEMAMGAIRSVAEDRMPDEVWPRVLASAELARHRWARNSGALMHLISDSFLEHRPWATVAATLSAPPPTRAEVVAAARSLLQRGHVVGYKQPGKPWTLDAPDLPATRLPTSFGKHSPFLRALLDAPSTPLEPRFLVAGSHYEVTTHGAARVITTKSDGPVFRLEWVWPIGVAEDPWICEAVQARVVQVPIPGADVDYYCTNEDTSIDIAAPVARFDEIMPALVAWMHDAELPDRQVRDLLDRTLQWRTDARTDPMVRALATHNFALRGEHAFNAHIADDATLRRRGPATLPESWKAVQAYDPDILYVGPSPERLRELLPTPTGRTKGGLTPRTFRTLSRPTVFVLHDPEREQASVRAAIPWIASSPRDALAAALHAEAVLETTMTGGPPDLDPEYPSYDVRWSPAAPIAIGIGYACPNQEVPLALRTAIDGIRRRMPQAEFAAARDRLEIAFRADRTALPYVPELVRAWGPGADDPRVAQWLALPSLSYRDLQRYYDGIAASEPILSVVGDLDKLDMAALRELGEVVVVELDEVLRDPGLFEIGWNEPPLMMGE
jgi:peptidase M16-like protein